jgi:pyridoxine 5-phosphate synthase
MPKLGVNIDHIATVRQARRSGVPDLCAAARICEKSGAHSIVCHLREDRRHIQDRDVSRLKRSIGTRLNLEMSIAPEIVGIACRVKPDQATLVPERRQELTTEGGLDVASNERRIRAAVRKLQASGIQVSLFIDPSAKQIEASARAGVDTVELHTGEYANAKSPAARRRELAKLERAAACAGRLGLEVNAGHGLDYGNVRPVARIKNMNELNIGYSIVVRALFDGLGNAVRTMARLSR